jgi:hypothetical protein
VAVDVGERAEHAAALVCRAGRGRHSVFVVEGEDHEFIALALGNNVRAFEPRKLSLVRLVARGQHAVQSRAGPPSSK